jgi:tRNA (guanine-N7-)-methyltransferase
MKPVREFQVDSVTAPDQLSHFHWPALWQTGLLKSAPLDVEIGCGVGWHPIQYGQANPTRKLVAFEHTRAKYQSFARRLLQHPELTNLIAVNGDAVRWITHLFASESIARCFLLYPNPEPKAANRRWLRSSFMHVLQSKLVLGGEIHLATNEEWYFREAVEYAEKFWQLQIIQQGPFRLGERQARTHFEKKYLQRGQTCFEAIFKKC